MMDSFLNFLWWLAIFASIGAGFYVWYWLAKRVIERRMDQFYPFP